MNPSLTRRHLLYLLGFMVICLLLNFGADLLSDAVQGKWDEPDMVSKNLEEFGVFVLMNLVMLPVMVLLAWGVARRMLLPLRQIAETAQEICCGRLNARVETPRSDDELGQLATQLNLAFDRYDAVVDRQRRFTSNAAHQLRTPLASLRSAGEVALQRDRGASEYRETIEEMLEQTVGLSRLVEQLMELAALEQENRDLPMADLDLRAVATKVAEDYLPVCEERAIALTHEFDDPLSMRGNEVLLEQMVANLVDNAVRHAPRQGRVGLSGGRGPHGKLRLVVSDDGPGIPPEERSGVFQRFEQAGHPGPGRGRHGLGLSIVREIARVHQGSVLVEESPWGGASFVVSLPVEPENEANPANVE